jgi:hypothetical protein
MPLTTTTPPLLDDRFLMLGALGQGGMASVFRAFDRIDERLVALKVHEGEELAGPSHPLSSEFAAWSGLRHPNIVQAYELGHSRCGPFAPGTPYLVLEHMRGGPVHYRLRPGQTSPQALEQLAIEVLRGLRHIHAGGWLHRDLKPSNLLVEGEHTQPLHVKLTDFGLATPSGTAEAPGTISGSLPYVSPESLLGLPLDGRTDLYGLGISLYQLATGELPVPGGSAEETIRWHLDGPLADPRRIRPRFPARLARFIHRLSSRNRDERPASAAEALEQLELTGVNGTSIPSLKQRPALAGLRAERAMLRLALDAARLGAMRVFRLPARPSTRKSLIEEVRIWSQIRGLGYHRLAKGTGTDTQKLERLVLKLLLERGSCSRQAVERFGLSSVIPLDLLGDVPILDRHPSSSARIPNDTDSIAICAHRLGKFVIDCATRHSMVLHIDPPSMTSKRIRALHNWLVKWMQGQHGKPTGQGGLLLLVER